MCETSSYMCYLNFSQSVSLLLYLFYSKIPTLPYRVYSSSTTETPQITADEETHDN